MSFVRNGIIMDMANMFSIPESPNLPSFIRANRSIGFMAALGAHWNWGLDSALPSMQLMMNGIIIIFSRLESPLLPSLLPSFMRANRSRGFICWPFPPIPGSCNPSNIRVPSKILKITSTVVRPVSLSVMAVVSPLSPLKRRTVSPLGLPSFVLLTNVTFASLRPSAVLLRNT